MNPWMKMRHALRPIFRPPAGGGREAWVHHGFRAAMVLVIALAVPWLFPRTSLPAFDGIELNRVAEQDVIARVGFEVPKPPGELAAEQRAAEATVPTILSLDPSRVDSSRARVVRFFERVDSVVTAAERRAADQELTEEERRELVRGAVNEVASASGSPYLTDAQLDYLASERDRSRVLAALEATYGRLRRQGAVRASDIAEVTAGNVVVQGAREAVLPLDSIPRLGVFLQAENAEAATALPQPGYQLYNALLTQHTVPTYRPALDEMRQARQQAREAVPKTTGFVLEGERIIAENEVVGQLEYQRLQAYQTALVEQGLAGIGAGFWRALGNVLLAASLLGMLVFATYTFRREIYEEVRCFSVLLGLILFVLGMAGIVATAGLSPALVPIALAGLLAAALFDSLLGIVVVSTIAGILLGQPEFEGLPAPMLAVAGGVTAAFAVGRVRTRSQSWVLIALISGAYLLAGLVLHLTGHYGWTEVGLASLFGIGNATVCTALAMGAVLPALEAFTRRTTEQSLLELADMNRPLLRRLSREAPGTYAHSINMANLVEAACETIGADAVLARVGVYYHDIGKLERPQYFIENQPKGINPHDRLRPIQSAEVLREHVRAGLQLAREARLPEVIQDFIREHHGTQQIRYFLEKARQEVGGEDVDPGDFSYPGPKPQSKETAIAMLADAVESASRTLAQPSPERIRALIENLVQARVDEGELDECGLTFRDLDRVKQEFAHVLTGLYHHRIDYPQPVIPTHAASAEPEEELPPPVYDPEVTQPQLSIDLELAAQGDTGPLPDVGPAPEPAGAPRGGGSGRGD